MLRPSHAPTKSQLLARRKGVKVSGEDDGIRYFRAVSAAAVPGRRAVAGAWLKRGDRLVTGDVVVLQTASNDCLSMVLFS